MLVAAPNKLQKYEVSRADATKTLCFSLRTHTAVSLRSHRHVVSRRSLCVSLRRWHHVCSGTWRPYSIFALRILVGTIVFSLCVPVSGLVLWVGATFSRKGVAPHSGNFVFSPQAAGLPFGREDCGRSRSRSSNTASPISVICVMSSRSVASRSCIQVRLGTASSATAAGSQPF